MKPKDPGIGNVYKKPCFIVHILIICTFFAVLGTGCMSAPDKEDYEYKDCFAAADCMYRNKDNPDKSACTDLNKVCAEKYKEMQQRDRLEYCRDNKFDGMTQNECRLYLNQK